MGHEVFISYSSKDKNVADAICSFLENAKIRCWVASRDITPGKEWGEEIINAISKSEIMVLIFSESANASQQVLREVERAVNKDVIIIPFRIEDTKPTKSMEYFLYSTHWLDAIDSELEKHIKRLKRTINKILAETDDNIDRDKNDIVREIMKRESLKKYKPTQKSQFKYILIVVILVVTTFFIYNNFITHSFNEEKDIAQLYKLAEEYFSQKDYEQGIEIYKKIAETSNRDAKNKLGDIYYQGSIIEQDKKEAIKWYKKAADRGSIEAKYRLARIYHTGDLVAKDYSKAIKLYQEVASYGMADAQYQLGNFYEAGLNIEQDYQKALELYRLAAEQEHKDAQYMLAYMYMGGRGVKQNEKEAKKWYQKSAMSGTRDAQVALGAIYKHGLGVEKNLDQAQNWYQKAAEQGSKIAIDKLQEIN